MTTPLPEDPRAAERKWRRRWSSTGTFTFKELGL